MARPGITYIDVSRAAASLLEAGTAPTIDTVRAHLGSGSKSTLAPLLRRWKAEQGEERAAITDLPGDVLAQTRRLYNALEAKADARLIDLERANAIQIKELQTRLSTLTEEHKQLGNAHQILLRERDDARTGLATAEAAQRDLDQQLALTRTRLENAEQQGAERAQEVAHLKLRLDQAQRNLEHFREATQQQREREWQEWATRLGTQEHECRLLKEAHADTQARVTVYAAENAQLRTEQKNLQAQLAQAGTAQQALTSELETVRERHQGVQLEFAQLQALYAQLETQSQAQFQAARHAEHAVVAATERIESLANQVREAQRMIDRLHQDNTALTQAIALADRSHRAAQIHGGS